MDRTGERWLTNEGYWVTIIEFRKAIDCDIQFDDGTILKNKEYSAIKKGEVKNPYHKSVYGIGYLGIGEFHTKTNGKSTKCYNIWKSILERCYDIKHREINITYIDSKMDKKWFNYQTFAKWFYSNYNENLMKDWDIDKDILIKGNKIYSENFCVLVPPQINTLFCKRQNDRGQYPIGVCYHKQHKKFISQCKINDKRKTLGLFASPIEAFTAYKKAKESEIKRVANLWKDKIEPRVYDAMMNYKVEITD